MEINNSIGFFREPQITKKAGIDAIIPVSTSTWWKWVKEGYAPQPVKLGPRVTAWRKQDILDFKAQIEQ